MTASDGVAGGVRLALSSLTPPAVVVVSAGVGFASQPGFTMIGLAYALVTLIVATPLAMALLQPVRAAVNRGVPVRRARSLVLLASVAAWLAAWLITIVILFVVISFSADRLHLEGPSDPGTYLLAALAISWPVPSLMAIASVALLPFTVVGRSQKRGRKTV